MYTNSGDSYLKDGDCVLVLMLGFGANLVSFSTIGLVWIWNAFSLNIASSGHNRYHML